MFCQILSVSGKNSTTAIDIAAMHEGIILVNILPTGIFIINPIINRLTAINSIRTSERAIYMKAKGDMAKGDRNFLPFYISSVRLFLLVFVCQITYLLGRESCVTDYLSHGGSLVAQPDNLDHRSEGLY